MTTIIKDGALTESPFVAQSAEEADTTASHVLLPVTLWLEQRESLKGRNDIGVWLDADDEVEAFGEFAGEVPVIGLNFPTFFDGRSLSTATILRRRYGYQGELRAIGDVRRDQLQQMRRCGINAFQMAGGQDLEKALSSLHTFSDAYQGSVDQPEPLFRRRKRAG